MSGDLDKLVGKESQEQQTEQPEETQQQLVKPPKWRSVGTTLNRDELAALDSIAKDYDVSRNSVIRYAINKLIKAYKDGTLEKLPTEQTRGNKLKMPR